MVLAGTPRVNQCSPPGGQPGTEVAVTLSGTELADARELLFDDAGFETRIESGEKKSAKAVIKIAPDAAIGEHLFRLVTASGLSDLRTFYVTPYPVVVEAARKDGAVQPIALNSTVYGHAPNEERDRYEVELKKGERLTVEAIAARLQTQQIFDSLLRVSRENGEVLAEVDDTAFARQDPVASILAPEDGKYLVTMQDGTNSGPGASSYLLHLGHFAQPLAVYPSGGPAGAEVEFTFLGALGGPFTQKVRLPDHPADQFPLLADRDGPAPMPNPVRVSNMPNVLEVEPNDVPAAATPSIMAPPMAFNGIIEKEGDVDCFRFTAKKGQAYDLTVYARALRSPLDSSLALYSDKGQIASNDDEATPDSHLRWTSPEDGSYVAVVKDFMGRGGELFTYRLEVTPVTPRLEIYLPEVTLNSSQDRRAVAVPLGGRYATLVRVKRLDFNGALDFQAEDLPDGVSVELPPMPGSENTVPAVFTAALGAVPGAQFFTIRGELATPVAGDPPIPSRVAHSVDVIENGNQKPYYSVTENQLAISVGTWAPVLVDLDTPKVPILQNGSMTLKVRARRMGDFKGPVTLSLLYAPTGIAAGGTVTVKEGEEVGEVIISASEKAGTSKWPICVVATADAGNGPVWSSTQLVPLEVVPPYLVGQIQRTFLNQHEEGSVTVKLDQKNPFPGKARLALQGLPHGVTADPVEVDDAAKEATFQLKAAEDATVGQHKSLFCQFQLDRDGETMLSNFAQGGVLRVDKSNGPVAQAKP